MLSLIINAAFLAIIAGTIYGIYSIPPVKRLVKRYYFKYHKPLIEILLAALAAYVISRLIARM